MPLSPKQLAFAWINRCLEPTRINPEKHELASFCGGTIDEKLQVEATDFIHKELAKLKPRYQEYTNKFIKENTNGNSSPPETN